MGDQHQYGHPLLRHLVATGASNLPIYPQQTEPSFYFSQTRNLAPLQNHPHHYDFTSTTSHHQLIFPSSTNSSFYYCTNNAATTNNNNNSVNISNMVFHSSGANTSTTTSSSCGGGGGAAFFGMEMESNSSRWPRQETLTLLDIRSRLDSRFKEASQKGPLWDEISRIMLEEHGYHRSGKKCREKFENLYKYYKKTKEGKAGRQDGKHYRFFRQLEALYGDTSNNQATNSASETQFVNNPLLFQTPIRSSTNVNEESLVQEHKHTSDHSLSFSNTSEFETSSSENNDDDLSVIACMMNRSMEKQKGRINHETQSNARLKKSWKSKVKDFVDSQMNKLSETQEAWMGRMLKTIEDREQERTNREEEWKKQEATRLAQEHEFWAKKRAWIEARDAALMETLKNCSSKNGELSSIVDQLALDTQCHRRNKGTNSWTETEILSLIQLKTTMEQRNQANGYSKQGMWEEVAAKMVGLGHERSVEECQEKWDNISIYFNMNSCSTVEDCNKTNVNSTSYRSYVASEEVQGSYFNQFPANEGEQFMWINKHGMKLGNGDDDQQL